MKKLLTAALVSLPLMIFAQNNPRLTQRNSTSRADVELITVNVRVEDAQGRPVVGLQPGDFQLWEDGVTQNVEYFWIEDVPASIVIVLDTSGSMREIIRSASKAAADFLKVGTPEDQIALVTFKGDPVVETHFTNDLSLLLAKLQTYQNPYSAGGMTALWDAMVFALDYVRQGMHPRKAVVGITDMDDRVSRFNEKDFAKFMREQYVQVYWLDTRFMHELDPFGRNQLDAERIRIMLKSQYLLGYRSTNETPRDGKWHDIRVRVRPQRNLPRFTVTARPGYYASGGQ
jgi:VWFA-related protein